MEVGLAAYTDRLSGRPGDVIRFFVSSTHDGANLESRKITAKLTRCICSDPNPKGPGCIEHDASEWFPPREFEGRHQHINNGSYARSRDAIGLDSAGGVKFVSIDIWMFPTLVVAPSKKDADDNASLQCVWSWGELGLYLKEDGLLSICQNGEDIVTSTKSLSNKKWYHITTAIIMDEATSPPSCHHCRLVIVEQDRISKKESLLMTAADSCIPHLVPSVDNLVTFSYPQGGHSTEGWRTLES